MSLVAVKRLKCLSVKCDEKSITKPTVVSLHACVVKDGQIEKIMTCLTFSTDTKIMYVENVIYVTVIMAIDF